MMTLRLFALRLAAAIVDYVADRSVRASLGLARALVVERAQYVRGAKSRIASDTRIVLRGGQTFLMHADGRLTPALGSVALPSQWLRVQRGGRA
jgi:hypothetical protein